MKQGEKIGVPPSVQSPVEGGYAEADAWIVMFLNRLISGTYLRDSAGWCLGRAAFDEGVVPAWRHLPENASSYSIAGVFAFGGGSTATGGKSNCAPGTLHALGYVLRERIKEWG